MGRYRQGDIADLPPVKLRWFRAQYLLWGKCIPEQKQSGSGVGWCMNGKASPRPSRGYSCGAVCTPHPTSCVLPEEQAGPKSWRAGHRSFGASRKQRFRKSRALGEHSLGISSAGSLLVMWYMAAHWFSWCENGGLPFSISMTEQPNDQWQNGTHPIKPSDQGSLTPV